jgi:hypothetical protein
MAKRLILIFLLIQGLSFAQKAKPVQGIWFAGKTLIDPKVGIVKLVRVKHDDMGHGTFLWFKDTANVSLYYSPMCGNDCIWNYEGAYSEKEKLNIKFKTYSQHGFCKTLSKSYKKTEMNFNFKVEPKGKDTLILTRLAK